MNHRCICTARLECQTSEVHGRRGVARLLTSGGGHPLLVHVSNSVALPSGRTAPVALPSGTSAPVGLPSGTSAPVARQHQWHASTSGTSAPVPSPVTRQHQCPPQWYVSTIGPPQWQVSTSGPPQWWWVACTNAEEEVAVTWEAITVYFKVILTGRNQTYPNVAKSWLGWSRH